MRKIYLVFLFLLSCKSIPIQEKEAKQIAELETVKSDVESSNMTRQAKERSVKTIDTAQKMISEQGQTITECKQDLEAAAPWKWRFILENVGLVVLFGAFLWKRFG